MSRAVSLRLAAVFLLLFAIAALFAPRRIKADELKLKDGTTISGTIVGFEDNSFKVKTAYGYAVVQKDQVVSIGMTDAPKIPAEKKLAPTEEKASTPAKSKSESVAAPAPTAAPASVAQAPAATAVLAKPASPEPIREQVAGNKYTNETYRFSMYKPPDWQVIAAARALLPGAIAALGTDDDSTYLLIGQQAAGKSVAADMDAAERRLRDVMENFRSLGEEHITVAGSPATEHRFRGSVDEHDWSGVIVLVSRGTHIYTIFGMTRADSDLVQIQENVIARAISSLQFTE
jgi:hypothetical protein